jgi:SPP1 gp7 family putative phage head morphogenesis protein
VTDELDLLIEATLRSTRLARTPLPLQEAGTVYDQAQRHRRQLLTREEKASRAALRAYGTARKDLRGLLSVLTRKMKAAADAGTDISPAWLAKERRLRTLLDQVDKQVLRYARAVERIVVDAQRDLIDAAQEHAAGMTDAQLGRRAAQLGIEFDRLPTDAIEQLLGQVSGGPLRDLLTGIAGESTQRLADVLTTGLAAGRNPLVVARQMRRLIDTLPPMRAETIARTEMLRAYRESARAAMVANAKILDGWVWVSALDGRSCPVCVAMHGSVLNTDEIMGTHPNCRCVPAPRTKTWAELGHPEIDDKHLDVETGPAWFDRQAEDTKRATLGPAKYDAYKNGQITLPDLVGYRVDKDWGPTRFERPLTDLLPA